MNNPNRRTACDGAQRARKGRTRETTLGAAYHGERQAVSPIDDSYRVSGFDLRPWQDYRGPDTTTEHGSPVIGSARPRARTTHRWAIRRATAWVRHMPSFIEKCLTVLFCFRHFGAEIIKIEPPNTGDPLRGWRELDVDGTSPWFRSLARNKKSVSIDLRKEEGRVYVSLFIFPRDNSKSGNANNSANRLVRRLAERSDVVLENFKPGSTCSPVLPFVTSLLT